MEVRELWTQPAWVPVVAGWLHEEWFRHAGLTVAELQEQFLPHGVGAPTLPRTFGGGIAGEVVGAFSLVETPDPESGLPALCLANLFVAPSQRGRGYGTRLCLEAAEEARRWHIPQLGLLTVSHAGFYEALGWQRRGRVPVVSRGVETEAIFMKLGVYI